MVAATVVRDPWHHKSGARIPASRLTNPPEECWRCTELPTKRALRRYRLVAGGITVATVLLCGPCVASGTPLDPDPLGVSETG